MAALRLGWQWRSWHAARFFDQMRDRHGGRAFGRTVGDVLPVMEGETALGQARIVAAEVASNGSGVWVTYEVTEVAT